jgi:hypothetical protein
MSIYPDPSGGGGGVGGTLYGLDAAKPPAGGVADGVVYVSTDTDITYQVQGGAWQVVDSPSYTNATPMPADVGGLPAGTTFTNQTLKDIMDKLCYPYQYPSFTAFALAGITVKEVGDAIAGAQNFTFAVTYLANIVPNTACVRDVTGAVDLEINQPIVSPIAHNFGAGMVYHAPATNVFQIRATNTLLALFTRNLSIEWRWRSYWGPSANAGPLVEAQIEALASSGLIAGFAGTYSFAAGATYKYFAWPTTYGVPTSFKDAMTGFNVPMEAPYVVNLTNPFGDAQNYNVFRTTNIIGAAIDIIVA